jgi:translation initiation factor IF-3
MRRNSKPFVKREEAAQHRINEKIYASEIRLVIEGEEPQVMSVAKGIALAEEQDMDLVEISPNATPPVCKIMDYKKFIYNQKRKQKELKAKQSKVILKEIRFGPNTDDHDFAFKLAHAKKFLEEGSKVKAYVFFKGRTIVFKFNSKKASQMPKMKTKSSAKKRFTITGSGKIKRKHAFKSHILTKKATKRKRNLTHAGLVHDADLSNVKLQLCMK